MCDTNNGTTSANWCAQARGNTRAPTTATNRCAAIIRHRRRGQDRRPTVRNISCVARALEGQKLEPLATDDVDRVPTMALVEVVQFWTNAALCSSSLRFDSDSPIAPYLRQAKGVTQRQLAIYDERLEFRGRAPCPGSTSPNPAIVNGAPGVVQLSDTAMGHGCPSRVCSRSCGMAGVECGLARRHTVSVLEAAGGR